MTVLPRRLLHTCLAVLGVAVFSAPVAAQSTFGVAPITATGGFLAGQQAMQDLRTAEAARYLRRAADEDYDNPLIIESAMIALAAAGDIAHAATLAGHFIDLTDGSDVANLIAATDAVKEGDYPAALVMLEDIGADSFVALTGLVLKAWAQTAEGDLEAAFATLDGVAQGGLGDFLVFHRALMADYAGQKDEAIRLAAEAYELNPGVPRIVEAYARMLGNDGQFDAAREAIDTYVEGGGSHPLVALVLADVEAGRAPGPFAATVPAGASEMFHGLGAALAGDRANQTAVIFLRLGQFLNPRSDTIPLLLGQIYDLAGNHEEANRIYDAVPAASPMKSAAVIRMADNYSAMDDLDEALRRLRNIVVAEPGNTDALAVLGDLERTNELWAEAAATYSKLIDAIPGDRQGDWRYYYVRGMAYERNKEWPKAEADFKRALELNPDQPQVLNYLGYSWVDQGMNLEPALEMIERAVAAAPNDGYIIDSLGWAFYRLGRYEEAVVELEKAVRLLPNDPEINDHLGDAYWKAGRKLEARFQWSIAIDVDEKGAVRERAIPKLTDPEGHVGDGSEEAEEADAPEAEVVPEIRADAGTVAPSETPKAN
ncbi:MAG: tetratricopeptide repeat protein [Devosia sp.]